MYHKFINSYQVTYRNTTCLIRKSSTRSKVSNVKYQYLQRSKVPTMHFQPSLPRLPIPNLDKTCTRYLNALQPLLTTENHVHATNRVKSFELGEGKKLQDILIKNDNQNKHTSYISEYWFDLYLRDRKPLPINYNPLLVFQNDSRPEYNEQLLRASNLVISSVRFMMSLKNNILEPEVYHMNPKKSDTRLFRTVTGLLPSSVSWYGAYAFKAFPLDMSQFTGLFGATRIPQIEKDEIIRDPSSKHLLVQRKGHFYIFDIVDKNGNLLEPFQIVSRLKYILEDKQPAAESPLGILTTQNRDIWAKQRIHLETIGNKDNLHLIDSAIFSLILDDDEINDNKHKLLGHYLHGDGLNSHVSSDTTVITLKNYHEGQFNKIYRKLPTSQARQNFTNAPNEFIKLYSIHFEVNK